MPADLTFTSFALTAPEGEWKDVTALFVECFSADPYLEDPDELATIAEWGPGMLAGNGVLVTARRGAALQGFALAHTLDHDASWQGLLGRLAPHPTVDAALAAPHDALIVHELAVRESARGQGIARECMRRMLEGQPAAQTFLGIYAHVQSAVEMYRRWSFESLGVLQIAGGAVALQVLTAPTGSAARRLSEGGARP